MANESGDGTVSGPVRVGAEALRGLRSAVLRPGQPVERNRYPADERPLTLHLACLEGEDVVACGTLLPSEGSWRIRGMATVERLRGRGCGARILAGLLTGAAERGGGRVWCNARAEVRGFYERGGFAVEQRVETPGGERVRMAREVEAGGRSPSLDATGQVDVLARTPGLLRSWFEDAGSWVDAVEGPGLWSSRDVLCHLLHNERTDWLPRIRAVEAEAGAEFEPFERLAGVRRYGTMDVPSLVAAFEAERASGLAAVRSGLGRWELERVGRHPALGAITMGQLLAGWAAHDMSHLAQLARIRAAPLRDAVGPFSRYLRVFHADPERPWELVSDDGGRAG